MPTASEITLVYVCPLLGCLAANFMFAAPLKDVRRAVSRGTLGSLNPTPWAVMTGNCIGWVTYSYLIQNQFVFWANAPGLILSVYFNLAAVKLQYCDRVSTSMRSSFVQLLEENRRSFLLPPMERGAVAMGDEDLAKSQEGGNKDTHESGDVDSSRNPTTSTVQTFANLRKLAVDITLQKTEAPAPHEKVVVGVVTIWLAVISILSFLRPNTEQWKLAIGMIVNVNLCFFYGAPLSTIHQVLKTKDSSSIHRWTMLMNTANACFWTAFGFGIMDWFITVPNGLGAILGFIQMFLRLVVPSREVSPSSVGLERRNESPGGVIGSEIEATVSDTIEKGMGVEP